MALYYLSRFAATQASLRRVLMRRVERAARAHTTPREDGAAMVEEIVARFRDSGMVDDAAYAEARARRLLRRGLSPRIIRARLAAKGVSREIGEQALARLDEEMAAPELAAACRYVRRRRLGPYRGPQARAAFRERDLATLGRAGFTLAVARRVLDTGDGEEIEALLRSAG